jgi:hypothetical protein
MGLFCVLNPYPMSNNRLIYDNEFIHFDEKKYSRMSVGQAKGLEKRPLVPKQPF